MLRKKKLIELKCMNKTNYLNWQKLVLLVIINFVMYNSM